MANAEHLEILKSGTTNWNRWRADNKYIRPDLTQADLSDANLGSVDFMSGVDLSNVNLSGAILSSADLSYANLSGANLSYADLRHANLSYASLWLAILPEANLSGANFKFTTLAHTFFGNSNLSNCVSLDTVIVRLDCFIDLQTIRNTKEIPRLFLLKIGLPELYIDYLPDFYNDGKIRFYSVFLSHSWGNKDFAQKIYEALIKRRVRVFWDEKNMRPGDDIFESISKGINLYDKMILICSKESLSESWWVDRELDRILAKERRLQKERGKQINLLIPITIDDYVFSWDGTKGEEIRRYVIGDFQEWQDEERFEKSLNELVHALNVDRLDIKPPSFL